MSIEPKKAILMRLYQVLFEYSDEAHPLTQQQIIHLLYRDYGIEVERKAIGRNISCLSEMGFEIISNRGGCYLAERPFENSELRLLIDSVLCSKYINATHSKDLIDKLIKFGGNNFKSRVKHVYTVNDRSKTYNQTLFYTIDVIDEAIENSKKIVFDYNKIGTDKKLHKTSPHMVSPYQMIVHNQRYYLMCYEEYWQHISFLRLDKITNVQILDQPLTPIRSLKGYENGINYKELTQSRPYMYADKPERITLTCSEWFFDEIVDWFGLDAQAQKNDDGNITVTLTASCKAMEYWALQYGAYVKVLHPQHLCESIKEKIAIMAQKYS